MFKHLKKLWYRFLDRHLSIEKLVPSLDRKKKNIDVHPGDIVFAAMNIPLHSLKKIPESHRIRPYIVAKTEDGKIFGYCGGSSKKRSSQYNSFFLSPDEYDVLKSGNIHFNKCHFIPKDYILRNCDYTVIGSANTFDVPDLDLRPAEMKRSTMASWFRIAMLRVCFDRYRNTYRTTFGMIPIRKI